MTDVYYRYEDWWGYDEEPSYHLNLYRIVKQTPKGVWLHVGYGVKNKFVLDGARKRFAYPTQELAFESYKIRKWHQLQHCKHHHDATLKRLKKLDEDISGEKFTFTQSDGLIELL